MGFDYDSDRDASGDDYDLDQHSASENADRHGYEHGGFAVSVDPDGDNDRHHNRLRRYEQRNERALPVVRPRSGWAADGFDRRSDARLLGCGRGHYHLRDSQGPERARFKARTPDSGSVARTTRLPAVLSAICIVLDSPY